LTAGLLLFSSATLLAAISALPASAALVMKLLSLLVTDSAEALKASVAPAMNNAPAPSRRRVRWRVVRSEEAKEMERMAILLVVMVELKMASPRCPAWHVMQIL
jgi:hypothetical protein